MAGRDGAQGSADSSAGSAAAPAHALALARRARASRDAAAASSAGSMAVLRHVEQADLIHYGLIPEFVGRFPVVCSLQVGGRPGSLRALSRVQGRLQALGCRLGQAGKGREVMQGGGRAGASGSAAAGLRCPAGSTGAWGVSG